MCGDLRPAALDVLIDEPGREGHEGEGTEHFAQPGDVPRVLALRLWCLPRHYILRVAVEESSDSARLIRLLKPSCPSLVGFWQRGAQAEQPLSIPARFQSTWDAVVVRAVLTNPARGQTAMFRLSKARHGQRSSRVPCCEN